MERADKIMVNQRKILLLGADNARCLGGILNKYGKQIKNKRLIRSNHLGRLTTADIKILTEEYNLKKVIDLRTDNEIEENSDVKISKVQYVHIPIFSEAMAGITHEKHTEEEFLQALNLMPDLSLAYKMMVSDLFCISQFNKAINEIANVKEGSVLWHCSEGKDRCGLLSVFMLLILGVDISTIYDDYLLTNEVGVKRSIGVKNKIYEKIKNKDVAEKISQFYLAKEEYLNCAFDEMKNQAGSADLFIKEKLNIDEKLIEDIRENFLI